MANFLYMAGLCLVGMGAGGSLMFIDKLALYLGRKMFNNNLEGNQEQDNRAQSYRVVLLSSVCWMMAAFVVIALAGLTIQLMKFVLEPRGLPVLFKSVSPLTVILGMAAGVFLRRKMAKIRGQNKRDKHAG
jgi:hypothetical protein